MSEPWVYLNGEWLPQSRAAIPLHDAGFVMGVTVTDLIRTFNRKLYRWPDHLARFRESCELACLHVKATDAELTERAKELAERNSALLGDGGELCLTIFATPGPIGYLRGDSPSGFVGPMTLGMQTFPLPFSRYSEMVGQGAVLAVPRRVQVPEDCVPPGIKQRSRMHWWLADIEAAKKHAHAKALLLNERGHVTETAIANFLIVRGDTVTSPRRATILPGVSLKIVEELCGRAGLNFKERDLTLDECLAADEAMLSGTAFSLAGVRELESRAYPFPGPKLRVLLNLWSRQVGVDVHASFREPSAANTRRS